MCSYLLVETNSVIWRKILVKPKNCKCRNLSCGERGKYQTRACWHLVLWKSYFRAHLHSFSCPENYLGLILLPKGLISVAQMFYYCCPRFDHCCPKVWFVYFQGTGSWWQLILGRQSLPALQLPLLEDPVFSGPLESPSPWALTNSQPTNNFIGGSWSEYCFVWVKRSSDQCCTGRPMQHMLSKYLWRPV